MNKKTDVIGMKVPAAVEILDAAGISHNEEFLKSVQAIKNIQDVSCGWPQRVIRQIYNEDGSVTLTICGVKDFEPHTETDSVNASDISVTT